MVRPRIILLTLLVGTQLFAAPFAVVLDAGHGGTDAGTTAGVLIEKNLALEVARRVSQLLTGRSDLLVVETRKEDFDMKADERRNIANRHKPGLFISLHFAVAPSQEVHGARVYVLAVGTRGPTEAFIPLERVHQESAPESLALASAVIESLGAVFSDTQLRISYDPISPLSGLALPAVLVEFDFLSASDASRWRNPESVDRAAQALVSGIDRYLQQRNNAPP